MRLYMLSKDRNIYAGIIVNLPPQSGSFMQQRCTSICLSVVSLLPVGNGSWEGVICVHIALTASTAANSLAEENYRFHLRTKSLCQKARKDPSDNADLDFQAVGPALNII